MNDTKIALVTNRPSDDLHCSIFTSIFELNSIDFDVLKDIPTKVNCYSTIIIDQFINDIINTDLISKIQFDIKTTQVFLLTSRVFLDEEEVLINSNKVSILSMPLNTIEIYNRIVNANQ